MPTAAHVPANWPKLPRFLKRPYARITLPDSSQPRQWIMRSNRKETPLPKMNYAVTNREAPVNIYSMKDNGLAPFKVLDGMEAFERWYTPTVHKVLACSNNESRTDICMEITGASREESVPAHRAKMAARVGDGQSKVPNRQEDAPVGQISAPRPKRAAKDFSVAGVGKKVGPTTSIGKILALLLEGKWTLAQVVEKSGVEGGVLGAEEKVLHRIRYVLFVQHGIGHIEEDGKLKAVLPVGFDKKNIFK